MTDFAAPIATVDVALLTLREDGLALVLVQREAEPYAGHLALPGGYVHVDEDDDTEATAARVLRQKTGLPVPYLEQLYTVSGKYRDPRGWSLSVAYYALVPERFLDRAPAGGIRVFPASALPDLPFDHAAIVARALGRLRAKAAYSSLPAYLLPAEFTLNELHAVYERVLGQAMNRQSFLRKIEAQGMIEPVPGQRRTGAHRPAQLYRLTGPKLTEFDRTV